MLYVKEFPSRQALEYFLQGKLLGSKVFQAFQKINVRNLTLTFTTPAVTVTFPDTSAFETASPGEILAEAESQSSGRLWVIKPPAGASNDQQFALLNDGDVSTGGTAAPILGLPESPGPYTVGAAAIALASVASVYYIEGSRLGLVYDA
jgi:hypothetical protein